VNWRERREYPLAPGLMRTVVGRPLLAGPRSGSRRIASHSAKLRRGLWQLQSQGEENSSSSRSTDRLGVSIAKIPGPRRLSASTSRHIRTRGARSIARFISISGSETLIDCCISTKHHPGSSPWRSSAPAPSPDAEKRKCYAITRKSILHIQISLIPIFIVHNLNLNTGRRVRSQHKVHSDATAHPGKSPGLS
jgi:hypothetical protein